MSRKIIQNPFEMIQQKMLQLDNTIKKLESTFQIRVKDEHIKLVGYTSRLDNLSPLKTMARGYSIVEDLKRNVIKSINSLQCGDEVLIRLSDGKKSAIIKE